MARAWTGWPGVGLWHFARGWGEAGTNGQHAYFQMLHQGTDVIPVEFIAVKRPTHGHGGEVGALLLDQHRKLLANCLAQSQALMQGKSAAEARTEKAPTASASLDPKYWPATAASRQPSQHHPAARRPDAAIARCLDVALYRHRVFVMGALWGINSFDQWGVELGRPVQPPAAAPGVRRR